MFSIYTKKYCDFTHIYFLSLFLIKFINVLQNRIDFLQFLAEIGILGGLCFIFYIFYPILISLFRSLKSRNFNIDFLIFLIFLIYIVDSMLNFPIERPINYIYLCFTIALFYQSKKYLNK